MTDLSTLDATAQAELVRGGELTAADLAEAAIERIERLNPILNAVVTPMFDHAREAAPGPFAGVPFLLKDLVAEVPGVRFTEGSVFLRDNVSTYESELVRRLRRAGLVLLGKTNTPEFGLVPACEPVLHGPTRNPWAPDRSTSGSSGGSAAAVAAGLVPMAHGNDLGGSLRFPASACGLFGLKPTRARVPLGPEYGDVLSGWACEHALTRSVRDSAALLDAISGPAPGDPYPAPAPARPFAAEVGADPGRLRIAFSPRLPDGSLGHPDCVAALEDAVALCASLGHDLVEADLPGLTPAVGDAIGTAFNAATAWIVGYWIRKLGRRPGPGELEPLTRAYWEAGQRVSAADYLLAIEDLQAFSRVVAEFLAGFDAWLTPTMSTPPARVGEITSMPEEPLRALERGAPTVAYPAVVANITGNPAMSVPLWRNEEGLPIGVHFLGRFGDEATLFRLAGQLEAARPWPLIAPEPSFPVADVRRFGFELG
ncbi:amidase [Amycolatopsis nalaikhensis]|uniref:Amidase n=1 Tax=Amycolatopsis nalaikhensis TaxID=715472 RepID=A0ABY8XEI9_9PSEU|nr:amidase [Amycolatopsis sp. 2-2]WIV54030.1 amidase [Amycolatopsis sp. 2-2]